MYKCLPYSFLSQSLKFSFNTFYMLTHKLSLPVLEVSVTLYQVSKSRACKGVNMVIFFSLPRIFHVD